MMTRQLYIEEALKAEDIEISTKAELIAIMANAPFMKYSIASIDIYKGVDELSLITIIMKRLRYCDDIELWSQLAKMNIEKIEKQELQELVDTYQNYFLDAFINSSLH
jgi:hypothetical protein